MKRTVAVIGAGGGGGSALVKALLDAEFDVVGTVLNDAEEAAASTAAPAIRRLVKVDLANGPTVGPAVEEVLADPKIKNLAAVVVCAGIAPFGPVEITPVDNLRLVLEINTVSAVSIYQISMPYLRRSKGRLILTSSQAGKVGFPFIGYYSASKAALESLADVMRREAEQWNVDVVVIEPGSIRTTMISAQTSQLDDAFARLGLAETKLYGHMYKRWREILEESYATGCPPDFYARTVMRALKAKTPKTRYVSDPIGEMMIKAGASMNDRKLDKFVQKTLRLTMRLQNLKNANRL